MKNKEEKEPKQPKERAKNYNTKLKIFGTFDEAMKGLVREPKADDKTKK